MMLQTKLGFNSNISPIYSQSHGLHLIDSHGIDYFDLFLNFSSLPFGHNFPPLDSFIKSNISSLSERPPLCAFTLQEVSNFASKFETLSFPSSKFLSFAENGGLAIEQVVKSFLYISTITGKAVNFYTFENSYHGIVGYSSFLTASAGSASSRLSFLPSSNINVTCISESTLISGFEIPSDTLNVLFVEPIRCTSGDLCLSENMIDLVNLFNEHQSSYIVYDEIQSGFYSTLHPWAYMYFNLPSPDVLVFGKRLQICGFIASSIFDCVFSSEAPKLLSSTFDGSILDILKATFLLDFTPSYVESHRSSLTDVISSFRDFLVDFLSPTSSSLYGCLLSLYFSDQTHAFNASSLLTSKNILHNYTPPHFIRFRFPYNVASTDFACFKTLF